MIDFALTDKGDLILEEQPALPGFRLDFRIAQYPGLVVKFFQAPQQSVLSNSNFKVCFNTKAHNEEIKYRASLVEDIMAAVQQVIIRLRTELKELPVRPNIGSKLRIAKHGRLNSPLNMSTIEAMTVEAIKGIVPEVEVVAKAEFGIGPFYCQNVNIYIYSNGTLFHKFSV
jgi:hypothetical protein